MSNQEEIDTSVCMWFPYVNCAQTANDSCHTLKMEVGIKKKGEDRREFHFYRRPQVILMKLYTDLKWENK